MGTITYFVEASPSRKHYPNKSQTLLPVHPPLSNVFVVSVLARYVFHYRVDDGLTYLCMADEESRRRVPFALLQEIKNRFQATYGDRYDVCGL